MNKIGLIVAIVSLVLTLILASVIYDMSGKVNQLAQAQGANSSDLSGNVVKLQTANEKLADMVSNLRQTAAQNAADAKQNATAIEDMRKRFNQLIDALK